MKRFLAILLPLALVLAVFAGCSKAPEETIATAEPAAEPAAQVTTMDEFLAAIGPDRTVTLAKGTYNLSDAADYGRSGGSAWYRWEDVGDGYQLVLTGVDNLIIRGAGLGETILQADPRDAEVLMLDKCFRVTLEDITLGHTQDPGFCSAGVVSVRSSMDVTLRRVGLYGCGSIGLSGTNTSDIHVTDCHIYDCSSTGIYLYRCDNARIQNTRLTDIGSRGEGGYAVFYLSECASPAITGCEITGAYTSELLSAYECYDLALKKCRFTDNRITGCAFRLGGYSVLEDCMFGDNVIRRWYSRDAYSSGTFVDPTGEPIPEAAMKKMYASVIPMDPDVEQTRVEAATVDELLAAIASNTKIVLTGKTYDLTTATGYGTEYAPCYYWEETYDGWELVICGVDNLTIESSDGVVTGHIITTVPRYANVLRFVGCTGITLSGFTAGHTREPGVCSGGVLRFDDSDRVTVESCGLYGCGVLGVWAVSCSDVRVTGCDIYECSWGGIQLEYVSGASIDSCTFRNLGGEDLTVYDCDSVLLDGEEFTG